MRLPYLEAGNKRERQTIAFGGLNHSQEFKEGELLSCENLSTACYPALSLCGPLKEKFSEEGITEFFPFEDGYLYIKNNELFVNRLVLKHPIQLLDEEWHEAFWGYDVKGYEDTKTIRYDIPAMDGKDYDNESFLDEEVLIIPKDETLAEGNRLVLKGYGYFHSSSDYAAINFENLDDETYATLSNWENVDIYRKTRPIEKLTIYHNVTKGSGAAKINILRTREYIATANNEAIRNTRFLVVKEDGTKTIIYLKEIYNNDYEGLTYITTDGEYEFSDSDIIYPYDLAPTGNEYTLREENVEDFTKALKSDKDFYMWRYKYASLITEGEKKIAKVGNYICVFPDKVTFNVKDFQFEPMEKSLSRSAITEKLFEEDSFLIAKGSKDVFDIGDAVTFSYAGVSTSFSKPENLITATITKIKVASGASSAARLYFDAVFTPTGTNGSNGIIWVRREVPDLEIICTDNLRLYGAKDETIYVSKFQSPNNFQSFRGIADDSYYIEVPGEGKFTGCIAYSNYILFFRENEIIKLYGNRAENFQISRMKAEGVMEGAERSLINIGETVFYRGRSGIYAYTGDYPVLISKNLDMTNLKGSVCGGDKEKYYIALENEDGEKQIYVYDIRRGMWLSQEGDAERFFRLGEDFCLIKDGKCLILPEKAEEDDEVSFYAEFCPFSEDTVYKKKYSRLYMALEIGEGAYIDVLVSTDNLPYRRVKTIQGNKRKTVSFPLTINRCNTLKVKLSGKGYIKIINLMRDYELGGERE